MTFRKIGFWIFAALSLFFAFAGPISLFVAGDAGLFFFFVCFSAALGSAMIVREIAEKNW